MTATNNEPNSLLTEKVQGAMKLMERADCMEDKEEENYGAVVSSVATTDKIHGLYGFPDLF